MMSDDRRPGTITATPNPAITQDGRAVTTVSWDAAGAEGTAVYVVVGDAAPVLFATGASGSKEAIWLQPGTTYEFALHSEAAAAPDATVIVTAAASPSPRLQSREELVAEVKRVGPWFHQIDLGNGVLTRDVARIPGPHPKENPRALWDDVKDVLPGDLSGRRILDVGCADGFFSVELARRGAHEVVAVDAWPDMARRVEFARAQLDLPSIAVRRASVYDMSSTWGPFDFAVMFGLLYHLQHPMLGLLRLAEVTDLLYLETITTPGDEAYLRLRQPHQNNSQSFPKWVPTTRCVREMLQWAGFTDVEDVPCQTPDRAIFVARKHSASVTS